MKHILMFVLNEPCTFVWCGVLMFDSGDEILLDNLETLDTDHTGQGKSSAAQVQWGERTVLEISATSSELKLAIHLDRRRFLDTKEVFRFETR